LLSKRARGIFTWKKIWRLQGGGSSRGNEGGRPDHGTKSREHVRHLLLNKFFFTPSLGLQHAPLDCSFDASALGWTPAEHRSRLTAGRARGQRFRRGPEKRERAEALAHRAKPGTAKTEKGRPGQRLDGKDRKRRSSGRTAIPNQLIIKQT